MTNTTTTVTNTTRLTPPLYEPSNGNQQKKELEPAQDEGWDFTIVGEPEELAAARNAASNGSSNGSSNGPGLTSPPGTPGTSLDPPSNSKQTPPSPGRRPEPSVPTGDLAERHQQLSCRRRAPPAVLPTARHPPKATHQTPPAIRHPPLTKRHPPPTPIRARAQHDTSAFGHI